jgi:hypothetical protein
VCVCVNVCVTEVIKCNDNALQLQWLGRRGQTKKYRQKERKNFHAVAWRVRYW